MRYTLAHSLVKAFLVSKTITCIKCKLQTQFEVFHRLSNQLESTAGKRYDLRILLIIIRSSTERPSSNTPI